LETVVGVLGTLAGIMVGVYAQQKASKHAQRSLRVERAIEETVQRIDAYLHHMSVLMGLSPNIARQGGFSQVPQTVQEVFNASRKAIAALKGPAVVRVAVMNDEKLERRISDADEALVELENAITEGEEIDIVDELWRKCRIALTKARQRLDHIKERQIQEKSK
jgi:hypothetical protein